MTIANRLKFTGLLPTILLILLSAYFLKVSYFNIEQAKALKITLSHNALLRQFLTEIEKERGVTSMYLGSNKKDFIHTLKQQRETTDHILNSTGSNLTNIKILLKHIRSLVDNNSASFTKIFFNYTQVLTTPIFNKLLRINNFYLEQNSSSLTHKLSQLYAIKENTTLERDFIVYYMTKQISPAFNKITLWNKIKNKINIFEIRQIANKDIQKKLTKIASDPILNTYSTLNKNNTHSSNKAMIEWFTLQTKKISLFSKMELIVSHALWEATNTYLQKQRLLFIIAAALVLMSLLFIYLGYRTRKYIKNTMQTTSHNSSSNLLEKNNENINSNENEKKSILLTNISHEIRTPLHGIIGFTKILKNTTMSDEQSEFVSIIDKSSEDLLHTVNNIIDYSKIKNNEVELENISFDASKEFENIIETYAAVAAKKNIALNYYIDPKISTHLKGDPRRIKEVLNNLLSNAIKFTNNNGEVNLSIKKVNTTNKSKSKITFLVQDNGIGIPKEKQSHIFTAFSQADTSIKQKYEGTGLGLTIASELVRLMGGKLELESNKDEGASFFFSLDFEELPSKEISYQNTIMKDKLKTPKNNKEPLSDNSISYNAKVLIAESNSTNQKLMKNMLQNYGITVDLANNGLEAFEKQRSKKYNLLFLDIDMPVMNGLEATHEILSYEEDEEVPHVPIIALTTDAIQGDKEYFLSQGMDGYLSKPIETQALQQILRTFLLDNVHPYFDRGKKELTDTLVTSQEQIPLLEIPQIKEEKILEEKKKVSIPKKILVAKKFLLEQKILIKTLENLGHTYKSIDNMDTLHNELLSNAYDIVFTDKGVISEDILQQVRHLSIITSRQSKEEIEEIIYIQRKLK